MQTAVDAADSDGAALTQPPMPEDEIVVTGSHIRRSAFSRAAPVEIMTREELLRTGATHLADIVANLTSAQGSGYQGAGDPSGAAFGTVGINLRGLGSGATLVLLNGRRLVPSGAGTDQHFGDLSVIPMTAVERVEVLKGGGAAVYGADAVGGVINVVTRKNWEGFRAELNGQSTTRWDQRDFTASATWGAASERSRVLISMSYLDRTELTAAERDFTAGKTNSDQGHPGTFIVPGLDPSNPTHVRYPDPACADVPGSRVVDSVVNGMTTANQTCSFDFRPFRGILGALDRTNMFGAAEYDVSDRLTVFGEVLASRMRTDGISSPSYPVLPLLTVPADHVDNPFGAPGAFLGRPLGAASGETRNRAGDDTLRILLGLKGDFGEFPVDSLLADWGWELHGSWGASAYSSSIADNLRQPLQNALNSCSDPSDLSGCFNPFYSAVDGTGTPNSTAVIDSFASNYGYTTVHSLQTYDLGVTGPLFELPAGDFGVALGGQVRHEWRTTDADHDSEQERYGFLIGNSDSRAGRDIYSGYLEVLVPILPALEVQGALRTEYYSDIDYTATSPFAGLTLSPGKFFVAEETPALLQRLELRAQATSAFRAPTVYQGAPVYSIIPTTLTTASSPAPIYIPVQSFGNPELEPERARVLSGGFSWTPVRELSLSGELWNYHYDRRIVNESAAQILAQDEEGMAGGGADARVIRDGTGNIERIQVSAVNIDGAVATTGIDFGAMLTLTGETFGGNADDWGAVSVGAQGTYTLSYTFPEEQAGPRTVPSTQPLKSLPPLHCKEGRCDGAGSRNVKNFAPPIPRLRVNVPLSWRYRGHTLTVIGHYLSALEDDNDVASDGTLGEVAAWLTFDIQYGLAFEDWLGEDVSLRVGVYNLLDQAPPSASEVSGYEPMVHDPRGRMAYVKLAGSF